MLLGGKYEIHRRLGTGGMSEVYLAVDNRLHMKWAVKRIYCADPARPFLSEAVLSEANALRSVRQENLVRIVDIFREGPWCFLVMEFVEGKSLREIAEKNPAYVRRHIAGWGIGLCRALKALHGRKPPIVHRDLKPDNVMIRPDGTVCLIDFGTAKQLSPEGARDQVSLGTRGFAAPEQFRNRSDIRTDLYSLAKTLEAAGMGMRDPEWQRILRKGMEKEPENRYQTAAEFERALLWYQGRGKRRILIVLLSVFLLSGAAGLSYGMRLQGERRQVMEVYDRTLEEGREALFRKEYELAEDCFTRAVAEVDGTREEGYLCLLGIYRDSGRSEEGLDRIDGYLRENYGGTRSMTELLYTCGRTAFYDLNDYGRAREYFEASSAQGKEEASYLAELSAFLSSFSSDPDEVLPILKDFHDFVEGCTDAKQRCEDDLLLAETCLILGEILEGRDAGIVLTEGAERAKEAVKLVKQRKLEDKYRVQALDTLSAIYRLLGVKFPGKREEYYLVSISYAEELISDSFRDSGSSSGPAEMNPGEQKLKILSMARMYEEIGLLDKAEECYCRLEKLSPGQDREVYLGHLKLLSRMGKTREMERIYREALRVKGIRKDREFLKIEERIEAQQGGEP